MPTATVSMPTATAPISKPAGFTKPAGFGRPQASKVVEEEEPQKDHPVILVLSILALLVIVFVCYKQYSIDQMPNRQSDEARLFGAPGAAGDDSASADTSNYDDDGDAGGDSADEGDEDED